MPTWFSSLLTAFPRVAAWAVMPVFVIGVGSMVWLERQIGLPTDISDWGFLIGFGSFAAVGSLLLIRRPDNVVSWIMASIGLIVGIFPALETYAAYLFTTGNRLNVLAVLGVWVNSVYWIPLLAAAMIYLPLLFPDGRLLTRRWWPVALLPAVSMVGFVGLSAVTETLYGQNLDYQIANPIGIAGMPPAEEHPITGLFLIGFALGMVGAVASVVLRFLRSDGIERQQLKWFLYAAALGPASLFGEFLHPIVSDILFSAVLIGLPVAVAIAVLRYRLYDIDLIIRRTLQYGILTALLALVYFGSIVVLQGVLSPITGKDNSPFVTVVTTLAIAALFNPLRYRIKILIDRRFFRRKYDAEQSLMEFTRVARDEMDMDVLVTSILTVVEETMMPEQATLWLRLEA